MLWSRNLEFFRALLRTLRHPGVPPPWWRRLISVVIGSCLLMLLLLLFSTRQRNALFAEGKIGTFFSVGYLVLDAAVCMAICAVLSRETDHWKAVRWRLVLFLSGLAVLVLGALAMFCLGDLLHQRQHYYFKPSRLGQEFFRLFAAVTIFGCYLCWSLRHCRFTRFWFLFGSLLGFLALDDLLSFHEDFATWINKTWLHLPREHPVAFHLNDAMVAAYGLIAVGLAWGYRHRLARLPWMILTMTFACLCFAGTVVADFAEWQQWQEESLKILAGASILAALGTACLEITRCPATRSAFAQAPPRPLETSLSRIEA